MFTRFTTPFLAVFVLFASFAVAIPWALPPASTVVETVTVTKVVTVGPVHTGAPNGNGDTGLGDSGSCNAGQVSKCCAQEPERGSQAYYNAIEQAMADGSLDKALGTDLFDVNSPNALGRVLTGCIPVADLASSCESQPVCCNQGSAAGSLINVQTNCINL